MEILKNFLWALTLFAPCAISVLEQIIQLKGGLPTFHLDYRDPLPIYEQLKQECKRLILSGVIAPVDKLPSVRELAGSLSINPNTIQRAYNQLEQEGLIYPVKGKGNFIADSECVRKISRKSYLEEMKTLVQKGRDMGFVEEELTYIIRDCYKEGRT